jgi:hypothetical protein
VKERTFSRLALKVEGLLLPLLRFDSGSPLTVKRTTPIFTRSIGGSIRRASMVEIGRYKSKFKGSNWQVHPRRSFDTFA